MLEWYNEFFEYMIKGDLMKKAVSLILAILICISCCACGKKAPKNANQTINYNLNQEPETLDPQIAKDSSAITVIQALYEGLVRLDEKNKPYPGVAEKWESNSSYTTFTFYLRKDAKWSNGDAVTAYDFVYAFERALSPSTKSATCRSLFCIKNAKEINAGSISSDKLGVNAQDDHTLVVQLAYSYEEFPTLTATAPFMPCNKKFFTSTSGKYGLEAKTTLTNGPFEISGTYSWEHDDYLKLSRSDKYRGNKTPLPSAINFTFGSSDSHDVSNPITALTKKTVDAIPLPASILSQAKAAGCTVSSFEDTTWGLCFNTSDKLMKNAAIRKAFVQTLNRSKILSHLPENNEQADDIITPFTTFMGKTYRQLAGSKLYAKESDSVVSALPAALKSLSLDSLPSVTVIGPNDTNTKLMMNEMLATWNSKMGNYFNMEPLASDKLASRIASGDYQVAICPIRPSGDGPAQLLSVFQSSNSSNPAHLKDTSYDALLKTAETQSGKDALNSYVKAEKYLNDQCIFYPLYYESHYYASAKGVTGIVFHPYDMGIDFINAGKES